MLLKFGARVSHAEQQLLTLWSKVVALTLDSLLFLSTLVECAGQVVRREAACDETWFDCLVKEFAITRRSQSRVLLFSRNAGKGPSQDE
jgi:DNA-binding winged helix-turn-helix (wHTH) protein